MQKSIADKKALIELWQGKLSKEVIDAFKRVPRESFVVPELVELAYEDCPLPLLRGKTISQPSTVLIMTALLDMQPEMQVLELGTGSGYQAAILAVLAGKTGQVITCEVIPELVQFSRQNLEREGITNVKVIECDGSRGLPEQGMFDRIILTCAAPDFPQPLINQLKEGGIIAGPLGSKQEQVLTVGKKNQGRLERSLHGQFVFLPLIGKFGFEE